MDTPLKTIIISIILFIPLCLGQGCKKIEPQIIVEQSEYTIGSDGGQITIEVSSNIAFTTSIPTECGWLSVQSTKGFSESTLVLIVSPNEETENRSCILSLKNDEYNLTESIRITQFQKDVLSLTVSELFVSSKEEEVLLSYEANYTPRCQSNNDWIEVVGTKTIEDCTLIIRVKQNTTYDVRDGSISLYNNDAVVGVVTIQQESAIRVQSFTLDPSKVTLFVGQELSLDCTIEPADAYYSSIEWVSSNPAIASISSEGIIRGVYPGETLISVTCGGITKSCLCTILGTANCYIVSAPGTYQIPLVKGKTQIAIQGASAARVMWESFGTTEMPHSGDIIADVHLSDGIITYSTPSKLRDGNALIAVLDNAGNILWSWHIWTCNGYNPEESACRYAPTNTVFMDRNIGALSTKPADITSLGLYYEWGRKDPFLGPSGIYGHYTEPVKSTGEWPGQLHSSTVYGTMEYAIAHPMTFIGFGYTNDGDWLYAYRATSFWGVDLPLYDPCPSGWRVPLESHWDCWIDTSVDLWGNVISGYKATYPFDETNCGMDFSEEYSYPHTWYPAAGEYKSDDTYFCLGYIGYYWSASTSGSYAYAFKISNQNEIFTRCKMTRASGYPVRCVKE